LENREIEDLKDYEVLKDHLEKLEVMETLGK